MTLQEVAQPGPARSAAIAAAASRLRMELGLCGDRSFVIASHIVDAAIAGALSRAPAQRGGEDVDGRR